MRALTSPEHVRMALNQHPAHIPPEKILAVYDTAAQC
jgi:hypothetical protein